MWRQLGSARHGFQRVRARGIGILTRFASLKLMRSRCGDSSTPQHTFGYDVFPRPTDCEMPVDVASEKKVSTDKADTSSAAVQLAEKIDESAPHVRRRLPATKCATLSCLSLPTDGDFVSQRESWFMDWSMRLFPMNKVSTDLGNSIFTSLTHPLELEVCESHVLRVASPVSPVFSFS